MYVEARVHWGLGEKTYKIRFIELLWANMKHFLIFCVVLSLALIACTQAPTQPSEQTGKQTVVIAMQLPLSGELSWIGDTDRKAAELAFIEIQQQDTKYNYELIFEDDKFDAALATSVALELISIKHVDALMTIGSTSGHVVAPIADQYGIVHFGIASDQTVAEGKYNFIHYTRPQEEASKLIEELKKRGYTKVALITQNQEGNWATEQMIKDLAAPAGLTITTAQHYTDGDKDFRTIWLKVQESKPDVVVVLAFSPGFEQIMKQYTESEIAIPVTAIESPELSDNPELFEGKWYVMAAEANDAFRTAYIAAYNESYKVAAPNTYDNLKLLVYGFEHADAAPGEKPTPEQVAAALYQVKDFPGSLGLLTINADGVVISQATVKEIRNGVPVVIS
jgi:branched-chain amino acid transport system substrate-binding protein